MQEIIEFNFVCSKNAVKVKEFLNTIPKTIECINYMNILKKLAKNDYLQIDPSDAVVSSYLIKNLKAALKSSSTNSIYYVVSNSDLNTITNVINYSSSQTQKELEFNMYHTADIDLTEIKHLFNEINKF